MSDPLRAAVTSLIERHDLAPDDMHAAFSQIMDGQADEIVVAAFLTALRTKGEVASEIVGAARAMQERATPINCTRTGLLDTCGTGGDQLHTFNISTATALVVAGAGVSVAKHGNRSVSSSSGSADVLEALGVKIDLRPEQIARSIDEIGIGFCFAPLLHSAMKNVAGVRKRLGFRTVFNLLGPLTNPARAEYQLIGANRVQTAELLANALVHLGRTRAMVVCGNDQLDEVSLWGETAAFLVEGNRVERLTYSAASFGLAGCTVDQVRVNSAAESAAVIRRILAGERCPARDLVVANAAVAMLAAQRCDTLGNAVHTVSRSIDAGKAQATLDALVRITNG